MVFCTISKQSHGQLLRDVKGYVQGTKEYIGVIYRDRDPKKPQIRDRKTKRNEAGGLTCVTFENFEVRT